MIRVAWVGLGLGVMVDGHRVVWCEDRAPRCEVRGVCCDVILSQMGDNAV